MFPSKKDSLKWNGSQVGTYKLVDGYIFKWINLCKEKSQTSVI